jgi:hypothetical protein
MSDKNIFLSYIFLSAQAECLAVPPRSMQALISVPECSSAVPLPSLLPRWACKLWPGGRVCLVGRVGGRGDTNAAYLGNHQLPARIQLLPRLNTDPRTSRLQGHDSIVRAVVLERFKAR